MLIILGTKTFEKIEFYFEYSAADKVKSKDQWADSTCGAKNQWINIIIYLIFH
jgi:hypothetical protein